jgi:hypothetical protein
MKTGESILCFLVALSTGTFILPAATVRVPASADTALFENNPTYNLGGLDFLPIGTTSVGERARGLVRFDLVNPIPFGAVVTEAALEFTVVFGRFSSQTYQIHRLLQDWGEGTKSDWVQGVSLGSSATTGEATWQARFHPDSLWTSSGGSAGADFVGSPSAVQDVGGLGVYRFSGAPLTADVTEWLANPGVNYGWIIIIQDEDFAFGSARRFASREDPNQANAPALILSYTEPGRISNPEVVGDEFRFQFLAQPGHSCTVQWQEELKSGIWVTLTNIPSPPVETNVVVTDSLTLAPRFYRIKFDQN